jgi:hypothetical protein
VHEIFYYYIHPTIYILTYRVVDEAVLGSCSKSLSERDGTYEGAYERVGNTCCINIRHNYMAAIFPRCNLVVVSTIKRLIQVECVGEP